MSTYMIETKNRLPEGYTARPMIWEDAPAAVALFNANSQHCIGVDQDSLDGMTAEWNIPTFNMESDSQVVLAADGRLVAYVDFWDYHSAHVNLNSYGCVHPDEYGKGIGSYLLEWLDQRARSNIPLAEKDAQIYLYQFQYAQNKPAADLLCSHGFRHIRSSLQMRIQFQQQPEQPVIPAGVTIRNYDHATESARVIQTMQESFRDHWGYVDQPLEEYIELTRHHLESSPYFDPSLNFAAFIEGRPVGLCLCLPRIDEDPNMAWVNILGVMRPWRRQGIALALLRYSFNEFYNRGIPSAGLTVDADSLTNATKLYEGAGMSLLREYHRYEKIVRSGRDIRTQEVIEE